MLCEYTDELATIVAYTPNGGHPRTPLQNFMTISRDDQCFNVRERDGLETVPQWRGHLSVGMKNVECMQMWKGLKKGRESWYHSSGLISRKDDVHSSAGLCQEDNLRGTTARLDSPNERRQFRVLRQAVTLAHEGSSYEFEEFVVTT
jgi:hypothetical protein